MDQFADIRNLLGVCILVQDLLQKIESEYITVCEFKCIFSGKNSDILGRPDLINRYIQQHLTMKVRELRNRIFYDHVNVDYEYKMFFEAFFIYIDYGDIDFLGDVKSGSIVIENGEVRVKWKTLIILIFLYGGVSNFFSNYEDMRGGIIRFSHDVISFYETVYEMSGLALERISTEVPPETLVYDQMFAVLREETFLFDLQDSLGRRANIVLKPRIGD